MLRRLSYLLVLLTLASCYGSGPLLVPDDDAPATSRQRQEPADAFVGTYDYEATYLLETADESGTFTESGTLWITKTGATSVGMFGAWEALGEVSGNTIVFDDSIDTMRSGTITYSFPSAVLEGNVLTIQYEGQGYMRYGWHYNSIKETGTIVATRVPDTQ